jgi:hypothetical protein
VVAREAPVRVKPKATKPVRREIFVLTPEEKRTLCFVLAAFVLGLATKNYRAAHPSPASVNTEMKSSVSASASPAQKRVKPK